MRLVALFFFLFLTTTIALAERNRYVPASEVVVKTPVYDSQSYMEGFEPTLGEYNYRVSWQGIGAAYLKVFFDKIGDHYHITAKVRTNSFVDIFYKLRYHATGVVAANNYSPIRTIIDQRENSRIKQADFEFLGNGAIHSVRWRDGKEEADEVFDPNNFTLDPFSAGLLARGLKWELGQEREFDTYVGKSRYLVRLKATDLTKMKVNGERDLVWVVEPSVKKLTATNPKQKLRKAKIFVTADKKREIVQITSEVFIGSVKTKLTSIVPADDSHKRARLAQVHLRSVPPINRNGTY